LINKIYILYKIIFEIALDINYIGII